MSCSTNRITIAMPQITSTGPKCLIGGIVTPSIRRAPITITCRVSRR